MKGNCLFWDDLWIASFLPPSLKKLMLFQIWVVIWSFS